MSNLRAVSDHSFQADVLESDVPVLVEFTADWCPPCRMIAPHLEAMDAERDDVAVVQLDVDSSQRTAAQYGVLSMPTMVLFRGGREAGRFVGAAPRRRLEAQLDELLARVEV
ncbi:MAG TPA: thioredoxin [Solirubrobacteraceae bacterium]|nr:thioredoxin [Solirubrobacteraceae bacterium]